MTRKQREGRPVGRPSLFQPSFCEDVVAYCGKGWSLSAFAAEIGVARSTLNEWAATHPEFSEALSRAKAAASRWWEGQARRVAVNGGGPGTATIVTFALRNFGAEDFRDRRDPPMNIGLPAVDSAKSAAAAIAEALRAYGAGEIEASQAETIVSVARAYLNAAEIADFEARIAALEKRSKS